MSVGDYVRREKMIKNRLVNFRVYNKCTPEQLAKVLGITVDEYNDYENGRVKPTIDIIVALATFYKTTVDEFYGYSPKLLLHRPDYDDYFNEDVEDDVLRLSELSWEEKEMIYHYRKQADKEEFYKKMISTET